MKISEAAKLTGLNVSSIRFYERKGLLMPQREDGSKYRIIQMKMCSGSGRFFCIGRWGFQSGNH